MSSRRDQLLKLLAADPDDAFVLYGLAQECAKLATPAGHTEALAYYERCLAVDPGYLYAYYHKGMSLQALERTDEMIATLRAGVAAAKHAKDAKALSELSRLLDEVT